MFVDQNRVSKKFRHTQDLTVDRESYCYIQDHEVHMEKHDDYNWDRLVDMVA